MKVAVFWSGGKDSCLACQRAMAQGYDVAALVTFILDSRPSLCHPLSIMSLQSEALGIAHTSLKLREPYREAYRDSISHLMKTDGIQGVVTGDIWIEDHRRWMEDVCRGLAIEIIMPLWKENTHDLLDALISSRFRPVFTCVKEPWFAADWLGREFNRECIESLKRLHERFGIDVCGENGEYHTMVLDGPIFKRSIRIEDFTPERRDSIFFLIPHHVSLQTKGD